jgi:glycosyltransferase involved in cell wall biosynthesis
MAANVEPNLAHPNDVSPAKGAGTSALHVLTLTPFFPSAGDEVSGCFIAESNRELEQFGVTSRVIAVAPVYYRRKESNPSSPAAWMRYPQIPGTLGLSSAGRLLYARLMAEVPRLHKRNPIDVIHAHAALPCGHAAILMARKLNIPFVVTLHGLDVFNTCFQGGAPAEWRRKVSIDVYRRARMVICISDKVQRLLREGAPDELRSTVVYNGTDPSFFSPAPAAGLTNSAVQQNVAPQEKEILIVGNLIISKGHELVLRAMSHLESLFPQLHCRIIGEGPDRARFEALAKSLGLAQRVHFLGRKSRAEVAEAMRSCSVFVLPSRSEGLGCVYLEAMACRKAVVACRGQGIEEIIDHGNNGVLIPVGGLEELVQALRTLLGNPDLCARIGDAGRRTILSRLTLAHQARQLAQIYREAIA